MRLLDAILDANRRFSPGSNSGQNLTDFDAGPLVALTCIDARLNHLVPEALGVPESHFIWLRGAGNIITGPQSSTVRSLALACAVKGGREILILGHTDCLVRKTSTLELLGKFAALGVERAKMPENLQEFFGLFASERQNVLKAVEYVRNSPLIGQRIPVHGALIDIETGRLELLVNGFDVLATANSTASPATRSESEAKAGLAKVRSAPEQAGSIPLGDVKSGELKIGEIMPRVETPAVEKVTSPAEQPRSVPAATPAMPPPVPVDAIPNLKRLVDLTRHYRIIGGDGKHYGPVPATVLLRWITDGRIDAETSVQVDGGSGWVKLQQLGEALQRLGGKRK